MRSFQDLAKNCLKVPTARQRVHQVWGVLITPGSADHFSHCNDEDGCGNMWRIYDHRTEGEIHINKRDWIWKMGQTTHMIPMEILRETPL